jgi:hypothetical protein
LEAVSEGMRFSQVVAVTPVEALASVSRVDTKVWVEIRNGCENVQNGLQVIGEILENRRGKRDCEC